jgi:hypothetical protein
MVSPLRFENSLSIDKYSPEDEALFTAYMDIQQDVEQEDFVLPLEKELIDFLEEHLF